MQGFLDQLNNYSNLITATATIVLAILTAFLWVENRGLRRAGSLPQVVAYLLPHPDGNGAVEFVLANVGKGPAFNVGFAFTCDESDFEAHNVQLRNDNERVPLTVLPQDEAVRVLFGIGFELFGNMGSEQIPPLKPFSVSIEYLDILGRQATVERRIDIHQFSGLRGILNKSNERKMAEALEGIDKSLRNIARQSSRFTAFADTTKLSDQYVQKAKSDGGSSEERPTS